MKKLKAITGAFLLATVITQPCFAKYQDGDFSNFQSGRESTRSVASVEPADLQSTSSAKLNPNSPSPARGPALYEIGIGMGGALNPDYPGSDQSRVIALPFPFGVYRGRVIQADRKGTRARLFSSHGFDISISGTGALPVHSNDSDARKGMDDLGLVAQLGPKVRFDAREWADGSVVRVGFSVRGAASALNFGDLTARGVVAQPEIVYQRPDALFERLDFFSSLSATFATADYMDYLYGVHAGDATSARAAYSARGGYLESELQAGLSYRTFDGRHKFVLSVQGGTLAGGVNEDSPLIRSKLDLTVGVAWVWTLFESEEKAVIVD